MRRLRSCAPFALCVCLSLLLTACGEDDDPLDSATAPTPPTTTPPTQPTQPTPPSAPTYSVSGTISETAPTETQRVSGVEVSIGSATATTNGNGDFTVTGVASGSHTLTASKSDYQTRTMSVSVSDANVNGLRMSLAPSPRVVDVGFDGSLATGDGACHGTSRPCDTYPVGAHSDGNVQGFVIWKNPNLDIDLELRCNEQVVEEAFTETRGIEELHPTPVKAGQSCRIHLILKGEGETLYTIYLKYPY